MLDRWLTLHARTGEPSRHDAARRAYDDLRARCAAPERHYHDFRHIEACLALFDTVRHLAGEPDIVELAIWFHDVFYDTRRHDNEEASARLATETLDPLGIAPAARQRIAELIFATRHTAPPEEPDAALLTDIDLAILAQPPAIFDAYETAIRQEYAWVPDPAFRTGRAKVLQSFLARPHIYTTPHFRNTLEFPARQNLQRSLAKLNA
jgi:predicted metal-dependent HD superfamily phosphohydrolase